MLVLVGLLGVLAGFGDAETCAFDRRKSSGGFVVVHRLSIWWWGERKVERFVGLSEAFVVYRIRRERTDRFWQTPLRLLNQHHKCNWQSIIDFQLPLHLTPSLHLILLNNRPNIKICFFDKKLIWIFSICIFDENTILIMVMAVSFVGIRDGMVEF